MAKLGDGWADNAWNTSAWANGAWLSTPGSGPGEVSATGFQRRHVHGYAGFNRR